VKVSLLILGLALIAHVLLNLKYQTMIALGWWSQPYVRPITISFNVIVLTISSSSINSNILYYTFYYPLCFSALELTNYFGTQPIYTFVFIEETFISNHTFSGADSSFEPD
jgi:hypothetical protein